MKRVLLTGARGFIGAHCVPRLVAQGFEVHTVSARATAPVGHVPGVVHHHADLLDHERTAELLQSVQPSHLLHLAWVVTPGTFWTSPLNWSWVNASLALIRAFAQAGGQRVVAVGSCAEYAPTDGHCAEGVTPLASNTLYGASKAALSIMMPAVARQDGLHDTAWARIFYLYGPGEAASRLVPFVIWSLLRGQATPCTHGEQIRDFLYVEDVADALVRLLASSVHGAVNIASGQPTTIRELLTAVGKELGREHLLRFGAVPASPDERRALVANVARLTHEVGWSPRMSLEEGVRRTVNWWRQEVTRAT